MNRPRFSVVIPTRERARTLRYALQTCLAQDFEDFEVIVCDNHSSPETREVVEEIASPRVRYVRADRPLGMSANWELAYSHAHGEYITYVGDDDGLMPFALKELDAIFRKHEGCRAIRWQRGMYTWPCVAVAEDANMLRVPMARSLRMQNSRERIARAARFELNQDELPMIYSGAAHRSVLEEMKQRTGRVFLNWCPDVYSGFAIAAVAGQYLSSTLPFSIAGLSGQSNGVATLAKDATNSIAEEFFRLNRADGYPPHPRVPDVSVWPVTTADSFMYAKDALFPEDETCALDRKRLADHTLKAVVITNPEARAKIRQLVRESLADDSSLVTWFDREVPDPPPAESRILGNVFPGVEGDFLTLKADRYGIATIADAVNFTTELLGLRSGAIRYDLDARTELDQPLAEARHKQAVAEAERQNARDIAAAAQTAYHSTVDYARVLEKQVRELDELYHAAVREGSLRNVPRRVANLLKRKLLRFVRVGSPAS